MLFFRGFFIIEVRGEAAFGGVIPVPGRYV
jgi:hypothetical protein